MRNFWLDKKKSKEHIQTWDFNTVLGDALKEKYNFEKVNNVKVVEVSNFTPLDRVNIRRLVFVITSEMRDFLTASDSIELFLDKTQKFLQKLADFRAFVSYSCEVSKNVIIAKAFELTHHDHCIKISLVFSGKRPPFEFDFYLDRVGGEWN